MHPRSRTVLLGVLLVSLVVSSRAGATGREKRQGTVLVAGRPGGAPAVLYVAARLSSLVDFDDLLEPRALLSPEAAERVGVVPLGVRSLVVLPVRDLAEGERVLVPVTGRTEAGELRTVILALVTRRDEVDLEVRVSLAPREVPRTEGEVGTVAGMLLASHEPEAHPRLALIAPKDEQSVTRAGDVHARVESILRLDRHLFVTVSVASGILSSRPWRLVRARVEAGCRDARMEGEESPPILITSAPEQGRRQLHTFALLVPEGAGCLSLTLEEDGPRVLRFEGVRLPP